VAGGGTLISFPVLLALGYPALTANVTSTVGIWPGYLGSVAGFRTEIANQRQRLKSLGLVTIAGAVVGAVLLLTTPSHAFTRLAPWLVLFASLLFALRPLLARGPARLGHEDTQVHRPLLFGGMFLAAVYGGYFGAAMGVIMLAVLGLALPDTLARSNGLRAVLSVLANGVAAVVFVVHGALPWAAVGALAAGCVVGGYAGALGPAPAGAGHARPHRRHRARDHHPPARRLKSQRPGRDSPEGRQPGTTG
jgi:hypothetical protein